MLWSRLLPAFLLAALAGPAAAVMGAAATAPDPATDLVLVVVPPWRDMDAVAAAAGTHAIGARQAPLAMLIGGASDPALSARLRQAGAWAVIGLGEIAEICGGTKG